MMSTYYLCMLHAALAANSPGAQSTCNFRPLNHTCIKSGEATGAQIFHNITFKTKDGATNCCAACSANAKCNSWNWVCLSPGCNETQPSDSAVAESWSPLSGLCSLRYDNGKIKKPQGKKHRNCVSALGPQSPQPPGPGPVPANARNVLYILVDDLRTQFNETYGHEFMVTPNIDAFAKQSLVFEQAHVNSQMCVPTRNSFMTGRRPQTTRVFNSGIGVDNFRITGPKWTTHPGYFKENGYFTTGVGKTFHPNKPPNFDQPMSWSPDLPYYYPKPQPCPNKTDVWCRIDNETAIFEDVLILKEAVRRLRIAAQDERRPFFLNVGFHKPHTPYRAPGKFFDLYPDASQIATAKFQNFPVCRDELGKTTGLAWFLCQAEDKQYPINHSVPYPTKIQQELRRAYYASVSFTDYNIGQLLQAVENTTFNKFGEPIIVLHSDHGYQLGERNIYCKESNYNLATHVPLIVHVPADHPYHATSRGVRTDAFVEIVDVMPTVIDLAGLPAFNASARGEPPLGGRSFAPLLAASGTRNLVTAGAFNISFSQYGRNRCVGDLFDNHKEEKLCATQQYMGVSVRTADYRLTEWWVCDNVTGAPIWSNPGGATGVELYNHTADAAARIDNFDSAAEIENLAGVVKYARVQDRLHEMLRAQF